MAGLPVGSKPTLSGSITSASLPIQMTTSTSLVAQRRLASPAPRAPPEGAGSTAGATRVTPAATVAAPATAVAFVRPPLGKPVYSAVLSAGSPTGRKAGSSVAPPPGASQQAHPARPPVYITAAPVTAAATSTVTAAPVAVRYAVAGAPEAPAAPAAVAEPDNATEATIQAQAGGSDAKHIEELRSAMAQLCGQVRQQHEASAQMQEEHFLMQEELAALRSGEAAERERLAELRREFPQFREVSSELMGLQQQLAGLRCNHKEDQARIDKLEALQQQGLPVQLVQLREHLHELEASVSLQVQELQLNGRSRSSTACHDELALTVQELRAACANDRAEWQSSNAHHWEETKIKQAFHADLVQSVEQLSQQLQGESQKRCADVADLHRRLARDIAEVSGNVAFLQEAKAQPRELGPGAASLVQLREQAMAQELREQAMAQAVQRLQEDQARSCEAEVGRGVQQVLEQSLQSAMLRIQEQTQACKLELGETKEEALERILGSIQESRGREQEARAGSLAAGQMASGAQLEDLGRQIKKEESDRILAITSMMLELRGMEAERDERSQPTRDLQAEFSKLVGEERAKRTDQVTRVEVLMLRSTEQNRKELLLLCRALCSAHRKDIGKVLSSWRSSLAAQGLELQPWEALNKDGELPDVALSPSSRTDDAAAENSGFFERLFGSHRWNSSSQPGSPVTVGSTGDPGSRVTSPIQAQGLELRVPSTA